MKKIKFVLILALIWVSCQPTRLFCQYVSTYSVHFFTKIITIQLEYILPTATAKPQKNRECEKFLWLDATFLFK